MVDQRSVEMLAFNLASRFFAYGRLAQDLSRSRSIFFKFQAWALRPSCQSWPMCSKHGRIWDCSDTDFTRNIWAVFKCIQQTGLKMIKIAILEFGRLSSLAELFHREELHRKLGKVTNFLANSDSQSPKRHYSANWDS